MEGFLNGNVEKPGQSAVRALVEVQVIDCLLMTMQFRSGRFLIFSVTGLGEGIKKNLLSP